MIPEFFTGSVPVRIQVVAIVTTLGLLTIVIQLIRRGKLKEGYSIIWFCVGLTLVLFAVFTRVLDLFARLVGITYSPAALLLILTGGLFLLALHFSVMVSKHDRRVRDLAQENALLRNKIDTLSQALPDKKTTREK